MNIAEYREYIKGKKVSVIGLGVSNVPLIKLLLRSGAYVTAHDKKSASDIECYEELKGLGASFVLGEDYLTNIPSGTEFIFKTPGLRCDAKELEAAKASGAVITSEMELFFELCPCEIIAVTGSDGKTTTTTLIGEMLKKEGYKCHVGGNIGRPLIGDLDEINTEDKAVLELSSFQLHSMKKSPSVAVVTNVTPNHLDWHTDFEEYIESKKKIFEYQSGNGRVVLNYDNDITRGYAKDIKNYMYFSRRETMERGVYLKDGCIFMSDAEGTEKILDIADIKIPGMHNVENYMAAIAAVRPYVSVETIRDVAKTFGGVAHRIEFVREIGGVKYYNDSIASSPARTTAGLKSFDKKVILIAGGYDKKIPFDEFGAVVNEYVKVLVLVGATSDKIEKAVRAADNYSGLPIYRETEFGKAAERARSCAQSGDIVILSPACASFDLFKNFEVRGNTFKEIVLGFEE